MRGEKLREWPAISTVVIASVSEAIQLPCGCAMDCFAALAMTDKTARAFVQVQTGACAA